MSMIFLAGIILGVCVFFCAFVSQVKRYVLGEEVSNNQIVCGEKS
jgi:hypothetical protein